jgi:UDP-N-acetylglucosamine 2-epimerase
MSRKHVCVVVTARPSYARVQTVIEALRADVDCELTLIAAASACLERYGQVAEAMRPDLRIESVMASSTVEAMATETGLLTMKLAETFARIRPEVVLVVADRHEVLAVAQAASYQNIPAAHLQGGEHTGSIDDR